VSTSNDAQTLADKVWNSHVVQAGANGEPDLLYIDLHLVHEVTSPQAFDGLRLNGRKVRRPDLTVATEDHNVPTADIDQPIADPVSRKQVETLRANTAEFGIVNHEMGSAGQGIVHVIGPEQGLTQPGMTVVCGDSHTATHGAFGALAFGIGTSEVEHVLATQTLPQMRPKTMAVTVDGALPEGTSPKDVILAIIGRIGTGGGIGHIIEYRGEVFRAMSMEGRMTVCNMSIEAGAKAGMIAPDDVTFAYLEGRDNAPKGSAWDHALDAWRALPSRYSTDQPSGPRCHGEPTPVRSSPWPIPCPTLTATTRRQLATPPLEPWSTWTSRPAYPCATWRWTPCSSARVPTVESKTFGPPLTWPKAGRSKTAFERWWCPAPTR